MPLSADGSMTTRHLGGTCSICSIRTRVDVEHVPACPNIGKPGHIVGCPMCFVTSRSVPKQYKLSDCVEYYKQTL